MKTYLQIANDISHNIFTVYNKIVGICKNIKWGDARCDSPGYSAKYGSYTLMDLVTKKILDFQLVQVCMSNLSYVEIKLMKYCCE